MILELGLLLCGRLKQSSKTSSSLVLFISKHPEKMLLYKN